MQACLSKQMSRGGLAHKKYWLLVDAREARVTGSVPPAHRNLFLIENIAVQRNSQSFHKITVNNYLIRKLRTRELFCKRSFYRKWSGMNFLKSKNLFFFPDNFFLVTWPCIYIKCYLPIHTGLSRIFWN